MPRFSAFRARMLRLSISHLPLSRYGAVRRRNAGTWDHYLRAPEAFLPGLRNAGPGSGVARQRARQRHRDPDPAERLRIDRGPLVRCRTLTRQRRQQLARDYPNLFALYDTDREI